MGRFLNSRTAYDIYKGVFRGQYFVDKTKMLTELIPRIGTSERYICVTRPRRFGKSVAVNMIASFFSKGCASRDVFDHLVISKEECYKQHINQYNVITISFNEVPENCSCYRQYIDRIQKQLKKDVLRAFPEADVETDDAVWDVLQEIYETEESAQFIFVLDEWDYIFNRTFVTEQDKAEYVDFLSNLLKDKPYVLLTYMTGILPIASYSSGSGLNMFAEYTMASETKYSEYFGFTEYEVDELYEKFKQNQKNPQVTREGLQIWYNGYNSKAGEKVYNPRSVVFALMNNNLGNYWTSSGPYDELYYYVKHNVAEVRDDIAKMVAGIPVPAKISQYAATTMKLTTKDEIFSAMLVYGFLTYKDGYISIPNQELMFKFEDMLLKEKELGYVNRLARESARMLEATLHGDTKTMAEILTYAHDTESPLLVYNNETELTMLVNLVYLHARDIYQIEREDKAGIGYVDFIFYPKENKNETAIILELKVNHTAEEAVQQIKDKNYMLKFQGKLGEVPTYTGKVLGVGIAYYKDTKIHECKVEVLRKAL